MKNKNLKKIENQIIDQIYNLAQTLEVCSEDLLVYPDSLIDNKPKLFNTFFYNYPQLKKTSRNFVSQINSLKFKMEQLERIYDKSFLKE